MKFIHRLIGQMTQIYELNNKIWEKSKNETLWFYEFYLSLNLTIVCVNLKFKIDTSQFPSFIYKINKKEMNKTL